MRSPFVGLLLQHGHVHSPELVRQLTREDRRPLSLLGALRQVTAPDVATQRESWHAAAGTERRLFPINSP